VGYRGGWVGGSMGGGMGGYGGGMGGYGGRSQEDMAEELRYLITELIDRKSWKDNDGEGSIEFYRGMFIITNTAEVHRKVAKLLKELREEMNVQVAVEALFITVGNNFLESIGLDLDVILNNGNAGYDYANSAGTRLTDPSTGSAILIPRRNSRLGFVPSPAPGGSQMAQVTPDQPYAGAGFVPLASDTGPSWSRMTPIGLRQDSLSAATPQANPVPGSLGGGAVGDALSLAGTFLDGIQVDFLIRATQADRRSSFLQAPRIVVPNGRYGSLAVTEDQAYVASLEAVAAGGSGGGQGAIGYTPVIDVVSQGRQLLVSATVSPDRRYVTMTIEPSVQEILAMRQFGVQQGGYSSGVLGIGNVVLPEIRTTMVSTSATVPDGGPLLLGGLKLGGETEVDAGVPVLNKIPVLKRAFSNRSLVKDEQTLLILVKPKIILQDEIEENNFPGFAQASKE